MILYQNIILTIFLSSIVQLSNGLNEGLWQDLPIRCITCNDEFSCKSTIPINYICPQTTDSCLTIFNENNQVIKRGCYSSYIQNCDNNSKNKCYECKSNNCNTASSKDEYVKCFDCSTFDNPNCTDVNNRFDVPTRECRESCMSTLIYSDDQNTKFETIRSCLDDKEENDRKICNNGNFCEACTKDFCNGGLYPKHRLRCYHCKVGSCDRPGSVYSKLCANIQENDKCIIESNIWPVSYKFGCLSDLNIEEINDMLIDNRLFICDGDNCNKDVPLGTSCAECTSTNTRQCITDVKNSTAVKTVNCNSRLNAQCYTKFHSLIGTVERGCFDRLDRKEKAKCLDKNNPNCRLCTGSNCNRDIVVPKDRKSCLVCNSTTDPYCHQSPKTEGLCFNYKKDDICVAKYVNGVTIRGCSSDIGTCEGLDHYSCQICSGENCNGANLKFITSSNKNLGMWQDLPLKCKYCDGEYDCSHLSEIKSKVCPNNNDECITIFNNKRKVEHRDCSSILNSETNNINWKMYCETKPKLCPQCKSNECNIANSTSEYVNCHYCGWRDYKSCNEMQEGHLFPIRQCYKACMTAAYEKTQDSEDPVYNVIRTCLDDKEPLQQNECQLSDNKNCRPCFFDNCNSQMLFKNWSSCHTCQGSMECKEPLLKQCESYTKNDNCFYLYNDSKEIIKAGCMSEFSKEVRKNLINNNKISFCKASNCSEEIPKDVKCVKCNSKDDEMCATEPESYKEKLVTCSLPNSNCYVKVMDGINVRGCISDLGNKTFDCVNGENCFFCNSEECNNVIYPPNRQKCFVCDSTNNKDCTTKPSTTKVCPFYIEDQKCVSKYTDGKTERGCSNELTCDEKDKKKCQLCSGENCNTIDLKGLNSSAMIVANSILIAFLALSRSYLL